MKEAEERDRIEMRARLDVWDDDESDETFYIDRCASLLLQRFVFIIESHLPVLVGAIFEPVV